jgi:hypothetical protein
MNALFSFLAGPIGRVTRVVLGLALILIGLFFIDGPLTWVFEMVGLVPLLAGLFDFCVFAPLAGLPLKGSELRQALQEKK